MKRRIGGMKSVSVILAVVILIVVAGSFGMLTAQTTSLMAATPDFHAAVIILRTDRLLREKAVSIDYPLMEKSPIANLLIQNMFLNMPGLDNEVSVFSVKNIVDVKQRIRGVTVHWQLQGKHFHTECLYKTVSAPMEKS